MTKNKRFVKFDDNIILLKWFGICVTENKLDSNIKYPMENLNQLAISLATDVMKSKKDSVIVYKKVNLKDYMEKLKDSNNKTEKGRKKCRFKHF